jgi:hypothetical protein
MALAAKLLSMSKSRDKVRRVIAVTPSGNYVNNGDTLNLASMTNPNFIDGGKQFGKIEHIEVLNAPVGYKVAAEKGTNLTNNKLLVGGQQPTDATGGVVAFPQIAAGAYPAALLVADCITIAVESKVGQ